MIVPEDVTHLHRQGYTTGQIARKLRCSRSTVRRRLAEGTAFYARLPAYVAHFQRLGVAPADVSIAARDVRELGERLAAWRGVVDELTVMTPNDPDHPEAVLRLLDLVQEAWPRLASRALRLAAHDQ